MKSNDSDNQGPDWVDRWSDKLRIALHTYGPPTRDWIKRWSEKTVDAMQRAWPPTQVWIKRQLRTLQISTLGLKRSFERWLEKLEEKRLKNRVSKSNKSKFTKDEIDRFHLAWGTDPTTFDYLDPNLPKLTPEDKKRVAEGFNPYTGEPLDYSSLPNEQETEELKANKKKPTEVSTADSMVGLGCLLILALLVFGLFKSCSTVVEKISEAPKTIEAWTMATEFVTKSLKAPSTASFGGVFTDYQDPNERVIYLGNGKYRVTGFVDSENSFGAKLRTNFICELQDMGDGKWRSTSLLLLE